MSFFKKDFPFLFLISLILLILQYSPYVYHLHQTPPDRVYLGAERYTPDYYIYLFYTNQGFLNRTTVSDFYTNVPHDDSFVHIEYLVMGKIGHLLGLSVVAAFYLFRSLFLIIYILTSFWFITKFIKDTLWQKLTLILSFFYGGLFWPEITKTGLNLKAYFDFYQPPDLINRLGFEPHKLIGMSLFLIILYLSYKTYKTYKTYIILFSLTLLAGLIHGITSISLIFTIIFYLLLKVIIHILNNKKPHLVGLLKSAKYYLFLAFLSLPLLYWQWVFSKNSAWQNASWWEHYFVQADFKSPLLPTLLGFLVVLGPLIFLSLLGLKQFLQKTQQLGLLLLSFLSSNIFLFFLGFYFLETSKQRYFQTPYLLGWSILAMYGLIDLIEKIRRRLTNFLRSPIPSERRGILTPQENLVNRHRKLLIITTTIILIFGLPNFKQGLDRELYQFGKTPNLDLFSYPPKPWYESLVWAKDHTEANDVFLSLPNAGHVIPAISGRRVFLGDFFHTPGYYDKLPFVTKFYGGQMTKEEVKKILSREHINYIFVGYEEKALGDITKYQPGLFSEVFKNNEVVIYKVLKNFTKTSIQAKIVTIE
ncbi:hypothetical protein HY030_02295 [Candidatus Gottesmanbacteria bacterium]|nr:hypothetical protein [Candidatus Gottesmanbacteria bacterium]